MNLFSWVIEVVEYIFIRLSIFFTGSEYFKRVLYMTVAF